MRILAGLWRIAVLLAQLALPRLTMLGAAVVVSLAVVDTLVERGYSPLLVSVTGLCTSVGLLLVRVSRLDARLRRLEAGPGQGVALCIPNGPPGGSTPATRQRGAEGQP